MTEAALTRFLEETVLMGLSRSRGQEARVDVYLELHRLLRLEDSEVLVQLLQHHVQELLEEVRSDLHHGTLDDVRHLALRTLSYFMYHKALARSVKTTGMTRCLDDVVALMAATNDEVK